MSPLVLVKVSAGASAPFISLSPSKSDEGWRTLFLVPVDNARYNWSRLPGSGPSVQALERLYQRSTRPIYFRQRDLTLASDDTSKAA